MATDRDSAIDRDQIEDRTIQQLELNITNTPTDGQIVKINMPTGDFTAIDQSLIGTNTFKQTFVNGDLTTDKITITHNLDTTHPVVAVYDNNEKIIQPTEIQYVTTNTIQLDFTGLTPITGTYTVRVLGSGGASGVFADSFVDADLSSGILTETHNLNSQFVLLRIYDNNNEEVTPTKITATDANTLTIDLSGEGVLTGTWNIIISTGGNDASLGGSATSIADLDDDTKVETEKNSDEDIIRFTALGTQEAQIDSNGLKLKSGADINEFSTDGTLVGDSDDAIPTEKAVKAFVEAFKPTDLNITGQVAEDFLLFDSTNWVVKGGIEKIIVGEFTRDMTIASGTQAITGIGFKPSYILFYGGIDGNNLVSHNIGGTDGTNEQGLSLANTSGQLNIPSSKAFDAHTTVSDIQRANLSSFDSDGFTLSWTKVGSPTGTLKEKFVAFR